MSAVVFVVVLWLVVGPGMALWSWRTAPTAATRQIERTGADLGLYGPGAPLPTEPGLVQRRFLARRRGQVIGVALSSVPLLVFWLGSATSEEYAGPSGLWVLGLPVGLAVGAAVGTLSAGAPRPVGAVRVIVSPREVAAYLPRLERVLPLLAGALLIAALGLVGAAALLGGRGGALVAGSAGLLVGIACWAGLAWAVRGVLAQPTAGRTDIDLAWSEALRALALRDLLYGQSMLGLLAAPTLAGITLKAAAVESQALFVLVMALFCTGGVGLLLLLVSILADSHLTWFRGHAGKEVLA